jgi:hypothetical protein
MRSSSSRAMPAKLLLPRASRSSSGFTNSARRDLAPTGGLEFDDPFATLESAPNIGRWIECRASLHRIRDEVAAVTDPAELLARHRPREPPAAPLRALQAVEGDVERARRHGSLGRRSRRRRGRAPGLLARSLEHRFEPSPNPFGRVFRKAVEQRHELEHGLILVLLMGPNQDLDGPLADCADERLHNADRSHCSLGDSEHVAHRGYLPPGLRDDLRHNCRGFAGRKRCLVLEHGTPLGRGHQAARGIVTSPSAVRVRTEGGLDRQDPEADERTERGRRPHSSPMDPHVGEREHLLRRRLRSADEDHVRPTQSEEPVVGLRLGESTSDPREPHGFVAGLERSAPETRGVVRQGQRGGARYELRGFRRSRILARRGVRGTSCGHGYVRGELAVRPLDDRLLDVARRRTWFLSVSVLFAFRPPCELEH